MVWLYPQPTQMHKINHNQRNCYEGIYKMVLHSSKTPFYLPFSPQTCFREHFHRIFFHIFLECEKVSLKWRQLEKISTRISDNNIKHTLPNCLLFTPIIGLTSHHLRLIHTICVSIHWLKAFHWRSPLLPLTQLKSRINNNYLMEEIYHTLYNTTYLLENKWNP